jgi:type I restriction-modification system DNA methylase subunit
MPKKRKNVAAIKQHGEVFTPTALVNEMLDKLSAISFLIPTKTFLDPACGDGQFLIEVLRRKMKAGSKALTAIKTIYGIDIQQKWVDQCRCRLVANAYKWSNGTVPMKDLLAVVTHNIQCANFLTADLDKVFA